MKKPFVYTRLDRESPPENVVVETVSAYGVVQDLKRIGRLFCFPDDGMHVYYEVVFWRLIEDSEASRIA